MSHCDAGLKDETFTPEKDASLRTVEANTLEMVGFEGPKKRMESIPNKLSHTGKGRPCEKHVQRSHLRSAANFIGKMKSRLAAEPKSSKKLSAQKSADGSIPCAMSSSK